MAWTVLVLVFLDELLAVAAAMVWGARTSGVLLAVMSGLVVVIIWHLFASPRARHGGSVVRPVVKVVVFALASAGLWAAGLPGWATALLLFSIVVNALAQLPSVREAAASAVRGDGA